MESKLFEPPHTVKSPIHHQSDQRLGKHCRSRRTGRATSGFSLVEVTMALGIAGFAMVSLIGLLPVSYTSFHTSARSVTSTQLAQRIFADMQQADFASLVPTTSFHDVRGVEVAASDSKKVFDVNVKILSDVKLPASASVASGSLLGNAHLKQIVVEIAENPGGRSDAFSNPAVPVSVFSATVSDMQQ